MKKRKVFCGLALAGMALIGATLAGCSNGSNTKDVYSVDTFGAVAVAGKCEVYYKENSEIPYIALDAGVSLMKLVRSSNLDDTKYTVTMKKENGEYVISNETGAKCVINPTKQTFTYSDYDMFTSLITDAQKPLSILTTKASWKHLKQTSATYTAGKEVTVDLNKYSKLEIWENNNMCYLPLSVYNSLLLNTGVNTSLAYNGSSFFLIPGGSLVISTSDGAEMTPLGEKFKEGVEKTSVSQEFSEYNYQSLCLDFDSEYGLRNKFTTFDEFVKGRYPENTYNQKIQSTDLKEMDNYLSAALSYLEDGHTAVTCYSNLYGYNNTIDKSLQDPYMVAWHEANEAYVTKRNKTIKDGIEYKDNTAFISFASFENVNVDTLYNTTTDNTDSLDDFPGLDDIPGLDFSKADVTATNVATDTAKLFNTLYKDLTSDTYKNTIKNVVVDLTANDGGSADSLIFSLATLIGDVQVDMTNPISGAHNHQTYKADINVDGKIDDNDKSLSDLGFKIYFLDSKYSFSSANAMPYLAKLNKSSVITLGDKTAGGPCAVRTNLTATGTTISSSSLSAISKLVNGKYEDIDDGIAADFTLTEDQMIDRAYIVSNIKNWVK